MRKLFDQRARLVVYVESSAADEMERKARSLGLTLAEWSREALLNGLGKNRKEGLSRAEDLHSVGGGIAAATGRNDFAKKPKAGDCKAAVGAGVYCAECGKRH